MSNVLRPFPKSLAVERTSQVGLYIINNIIMAVRKSKKRFILDDLRLKIRDNFEKQT